MPPDPTLTAQVLTGEQHGFKTMYANPLPGEAQPSLVTAGSQPMQQPPVQPSLSRSYSGWSLPQPTPFVTCEDVRPFQQPNDQWIADAGVVGFYQPGSPEIWDEKCGAGFLGNFWNCGVDFIEVEAAHESNPSYRTRHTFNCTEAAFQALKFWNRAHEFRHADGDAAFQMKKQMPNWDQSYGVHGNSFKGMFACLRSKFRPGSPCVQALVQTRNDYLLEHNKYTGRDSVWSDNNDGTGSNWLGMQIMLLRDELSGQDLWTRFITLYCQINLETGLGASPASTACWQRSVQIANQALVYKLRSVMPVYAGPICQLDGCNKPTWNGQDKQCCGRGCQSKMCSNSSCSKPTWNGLPGFCTIACSQAQPAIGQKKSSGFAGAAPAPAPAHGPQHAPGSVCRRPGCNVPSIHVKGAYCSKTCERQCATWIICTKTGCTQLSWDNKKGSFCSAPCRDSHKDGGVFDGVYNFVSSLGGILSYDAKCAGGCGKKSWNGVEGEFCNKTCRAQKQGNANLGHVNPAHANPGHAKPAYGNPALQNPGYGAHGPGHGGPSPQGAQGAGRVQPAPKGVVLCPRSGCGKPAWTNRQGEYCSKSCRQR